MGLSKLIWSVLADNIQIGNGNTMTGMQKIARRHGISCLQRLSIHAEVSDSLTQSNIVILLTKTLSNMCCSKDKDTGTIRFTTALLLNIIVAMIRTGNQLKAKNEICDLAECLCKLFIFKTVNKTSLIHLIILFSYFV